MKFVNKQLAIKLKEKGFDRPCINAYNAHGCQYLNGWCEYLDERDTDFIYLSDLHDKDCLCPTVNQVLEWLREKKNIFIWIKPYHTYATKNNIGWDWNISIINNNHELSKYRSDAGFAEYEDAAISGIKYVINNLI